MASGVKTKQEVTKMNDGKREGFITMKEFTARTGIHFTTHDDGGKLAGFMSLSTSCMGNERCAARIDAARREIEREFGAEFVRNHAKKAFAGYVKRHPNACICGGCFSVAVQKHYPAVMKNTTENLEKLTAAVIPVSEWPKINAAYFRYESFGDAANVTQVVNYFNLAKANPGTTFTVWTKSPDIYKRAIDAGNDKPKNLIIILSSTQIGVRADVSRWNFVDKVFTVYANEDQATAAGVKINCGGRKCLTCLNCYRKNGARVINELLK